MKNNKKRTNTRNDETLEVADRERLKSAIEKYGLPVLTRKFHVGRDVIMRCLSGMGVRRGSMALVLQGLDEVRP